MALGGWFRERGELDKAVGIHQDLSNQRSLSTEQHARSLLELSRDYMRAGMLDRAESLLLDLSKQPYDLSAVFQLLLDVYQQSKDWVRAIQTAGECQKKTQRDLRHHIAHYYCELAEQQWLKGEQAQALQYLKDSIEMNKACVRASILLGNVKAQSGDYQQAIRAYKQVQKQDPAFLSEIVLPLARCYESLNNPEGMFEYFHECLAEPMHHSAMLAFSEWLLKYQGEETATHFLSQHLKDHPSLPGLYALMQWSKKQNPVLANQHFQFFQDLVEKMLVHRSLYRCEACGFSGRTLQWQCPSCKSWDRIKPMNESLS